MKSIVIAIFAVVLCGCQIAIDSGETTNKDKGSSALTSDEQEAQNVAGAYSFIQASYGLAEGVNYYHPDYVIGIYSAMVEKATKSKSKVEVNPNGSTELLAKAAVGEMLRSAKVETVKIDRVEIVTQFDDGDTKYVAVKYYPSDSERYPQYLDLVPLVKYNGKWRVFDRAALYKTVKAIQKLP